MTKSPTKPLVSVCIPSYNAARHIRECIESALAQDVDGDLEMIVVDDASTDETWDVVRDLLEKEPRATIVRQDHNVGAAANWDAVLSHATGRYVKLLCSDDHLLPGALARQIAALEAHPSATMASGRRQVVDDHGRTLVRAIGIRRPQGVLPGPAAIRKMVRHGGNPFGEPSAVLLRREELDRAGRFDAEWRYVIDLSGYARLLELGDLAVVDAVVSVFRVWPDSWSTRLARTHAVETRRFHRSLLARGVAGVTRLDVLVGSVKAWLRRHGRAVLRWRGRRASR